MDAGTVSRRKSRYKQDQTRRYASKSARFHRGQKRLRNPLGRLEDPHPLGRHERSVSALRKAERVSHEYLKIFVETGHPFVVSTKGRLVADPEYLSLLARCNCVVQISMVCSRYDRLEPGTPSYEERLTIAEMVSKCVKRVIVRIQPYMPEVFRDVMANIPRLAQAGVYGIVCEGMKFNKAKPGMVRIGSDSCYPKAILERDFLQIKQEAHRHGLRFYAGENRLRAMAMICVAAALTACPDSRATTITSA